MSSKYEEEDDVPTPLPRQMKFRSSHEKADQRSTRKKKEYRHAPATPIRSSCRKEDHEMCIVLGRCGKGRVRVVRPSGKIDIAMLHPESVYNRCTRAQVVLVQAYKARVYWLDGWREGLGYICKMESEHYYEGSHSLMYRTHFVSDAAIATFQSACRDAISTDKYNLKEECLFPNIDTWKHDVQFREECFTKLSKTKYQKRARKGLEIIANEMQLLKLVSEAYRHRSESFDLAPHEFRWVLPRINAVTEEDVQPYIRENFPLLSHLSSVLMLDFYISLPQLKKLPADILCVIQSFVGEVHLLSNACNDLLFDRNCHYFAGDQENVYYYQCLPQLKEVGSLKNRKFLAEYANRVFSSWAQTHVNKSEMKDDASSGHESY